MRLFIAIVLVVVFTVGVVDVIRDIWYCADLVMNHISIK